MIDLVMLATRKQRFILKRGSPGRSQTRQVVFQVMAKLLKVEGDAPEAVAAGAGSFSFFFLFRFAILGYEELIQRRCL
jgi:hypothetical protein